MDTMCVLLLCFVFFFKQKTAYEMRISDWSSDVCSSDLGEGEGAYERIELPQSGTLWTFTIQRIPPKNPPYVGVTNPDDYEPYGVGYVSLGDEIMIEGRLVADPESLRIGMPMDCIAISLSKADGGEMMTYAFASSEQDNNS